jgi:ketosteroid isomerase-like protein
MHPHLHSNAQTLDRFYRAFATLDSTSMRSCYAPDVRFKDEVFTLRGVDEVAGM